MALERPSKQRDMERATDDVRDLIASRYQDYEFIRLRFLHTLEYYQEVEKRDTLSFGIYQYALIISSALTPFLISVSSIANGPQTIGLLKMLALTTSLFTAIVSALKVFRFQDKWVVYRSMRQLLVREFWRFHLRIGPYKDAATEQDAHRIFGENVEALIDKGVTLWETVHRSSEVENAQQTAQ